MIVIYYGKPRSGKTTALARIVKKNRIKTVVCDKLPFLRRFLKPYTEIYCTDPSMKYTTLISYDNLGKWKPKEGSCFILCEAGIGLNNRAWKSLSDDAKELFAMHGHAKCDMYADSQTVDIDITFRERAEKFFSVRKIGNSQFSLLIPIKFDIDVNDITQKIEECYKRARGLKLLLLILFGQVKIIYRKFYYGYFDSWRWDKSFIFSDPC